MNKYCEYVFTNEHGGEMCHLSNEICPKFFKDITSNCCERRAASNRGSKTGTSANNARDETVRNCVNCGNRPTDFDCSVCDKQSHWIPRTASPVCQRCLQ